MATKFRFRKYIAPEDYPLNPDTTPLNLPDPPAFSNDSAYTLYNEVSYNGVLLSRWNDAIMLSVKSINPEYKDFFKRDFIEDTGVDVYIPAARPTKACDDTIEMLIYAPEKKALRSFDAIRSTLNGWGVFEYYDNYHKGLKRLILQKVEVIKDITRAGERVIHFNLHCLNVQGEDNNNFNPSLGGTLY